MNFANIPEGSNESTRLPDVLGVVVDAGDDGNADDDLFLPLGEASEVFEDEVIRNTGVGPMLLIIKRLQIVEKEIHRSAHPLKNGRRGVPRSVDDTVDVLPAAFFQKLDEELVLQQRFAAGERDTTTRFIEEHHILLDLFHNLSRRHLFADDLTSLCIAELDAGAARQTDLPESDELPVLTDDSIVLAELHAVAAAQAAILVQDEFLLGRNRFRVVAPLAPERAALQEDGRSNARSIVHGIPLNIENHPRHRQCIVSFDHS